MSNVEMTVETPLTSTQIEALVKAGVGLWTNNYTKQTYVGKRYYQGCGHQKQLEIKAILGGADHE